MPNIAQGQRILVTAVGDYFGQRTMTSWLYRVASLAGEITDTALFDAMHPAFTGATGLLTKFLGCLPLDGRWVGVATWYQVLGPVRYRKVVDTLGDGLYDAGSTTANLQASITRFGEFGLRTAIGGIRVPMPSSEGVEGVVSAPYAAVLQTLADEMEETVTVGSPSVQLFPQVGVPGYTSGPNPVRIPVTNSVDLFGTQVQDTVRVIRRRTLRLGI